MPSPPFVRWCIHRDIPAVVAIESASFAFPWTETEFRIATKQKNTICMVAESCDYVVGYMVYELKPDSIDLLRFAVDPEQRRWGVGKAMAEKLKNKIGQNVRTKITLYTRETNLAAQKFWRSQGFRATHVERGRYPDSGEDGYRFEYALCPASPLGEAAPINTWTITEG
jgi:[ribosomal protein S18]-alanine N-acetyltransferase